jgi:hypothetical protein
LLIVQFSPQPPNGLFAAFPNFECFDERPTVGFSRTRSEAERVGCNTVLGGTCTLGTRHRFACTESENDAVQFRSESLKASLGQILLQFNKFKSVKPGPFLQETIDYCGSRNECLDRQRRARFHGSRDFAQRKHCVGEEVEGSGADTPVEDGILKWQLLYAGAGEMHPDYAVSRDMVHTLP